jgi:hypothetical protein
VKAIPRGAILWLVVVAAAGVVHAIMGRALADEDVVAAVLRRDPEVVLAVAALLISRLFLYLLAPGWALYLAVRTLIERGRAESTVKAPRTPRFFIFLALLAPWRFALPG